MFPIFESCNSFLSWVCIIGDIWLKTILQLQGFNLHLERAILDLQLYLFFETILIWRSSSTVNSILCMGKSPSLKRPSEINSSSSTSKWSCYGSSKDWFWDFKVRINPCYNLIFLNLPSTRIFFTPQMWSVWWSKKNVFQKNFLTEEKSLDFESIRLSQEFFLSS